MDKTSKTQKIKNIIWYIILTIWTLCTLGIILVGIHWGVTEGYSKGKIYSERNNFSHLVTFLFILLEVSTRILVAGIGGLIAGLSLPILLPLYGLYTYFQL